MRRLRLDPYLLLLFALTLPALAPLLSPGYFYDAHDGRHSVFYLIQFDASIHDGAWWPRWAMHHIQGYGYPTFLIQAPLGLYLGEVFVLLGAGFTMAAKLSWVVGTLAGAWGMYALVRHWLDLPPFLWANPQGRQARHSLLRLCRLSMRGNYSVGMKDGSRWRRSLPACSTCTSPITW